MAAKQKLASLLTFFLGAMLTIVEVLDRAGEMKSEKCLEERKLLLLLWLRFPLMQVAEGVAENTAMDDINF